MRDDIIIRRLADTIADLKRRIHNLETAPQMPHTSVRGGFTRWQPEDGSENPKLFLGEAGEGGGLGDIRLILNDEDGGTYEIYLGTNLGRAFFDIRNPDDTGSVLQTHDGVMHFPRFAAAWQRHAQFAMDANGRSQTASTSYGAGLWSADLSLGASQVFTSVDVAVGTGVTSCAVQITAEAVSPRSGHSATGPQVVHEETGIVANTSFTDAWAVPQSIWSPAANVIGTLVQLRILARVTGGTGTIGVAPILSVRNAP